MARRAFTDEELYTMMTLVTHYPKGGHGGEAFWASMVNLYKGHLDLFKERTAGSLRDKWRKLQKEVLCGANVK